MSVALLLAQTAATLFMTGVIWIVQTVHYPLFARVGRDEFREYARTRSFLLTENDLHHARRGSLQTPRLI